MSDGQSRERHRFAVEVRGVSHSFGASRTKARIEAVRDADMLVEKGEFVAVVGPSGCGKTTVLNMVAGLIGPEAGDVLRFGARVTGPGKNVGYMLARPALMPWLTALQNIAFGLQLRGVSAADRKRKAEQLLRKVGLAEFGEAYPAQLSHGMQQRVAVARTLAIDPDLLLLDEPFGALDAHTRLMVESDFVRLWEQTRTTVIMVTHDLTEAIAMADRVVVFKARPGSVKYECKVDLPRPRNIAEIRGKEAFGSLYDRLWQELRGEFIERKA
jgi:NitT/TauT family transport system ATP-binding protein